MATVRRNHKTNTDEKKNNLCDIIISRLLYDSVKLGKASGKNPDRVGSGWWLFNYCTISHDHPEEGISLQTDSLSPVLEVDDVGSLQARLQEIAQFYVLGGWARLWAAVLNTCRQGLQKGKRGVKKELNGRSEESDLSGMNKYWIIKLYLNSSHNTNYVVTHGVCLSSFLLLIISQ